MKWTDASPSIKRARPATRYREGPPLASPQMVSLRLLLASLAPAAFVCGTPLERRSMRVHESRSTIPHGFANQGPAAPDTVLNMRIALTQSDPAGLEDALMAVSTPGSASYGQHLTKEEVCIYPINHTMRVDAVSIGRK